MQDFQFELNGYLFGLGCPVLLEDAGFDPGTAGIRSQDQSYSQGDGGAFGRDFLDGPTWAWTLGTNEQDTETALATLATFTDVWRADSTRRTPGAVLPLRYQLVNRVRRVYGRPRRLSAPPSNRMLGGWIPITADFVCADALHYDDAEQAESLQVTASAGGGLTVPLVEPLSTASIGAETHGSMTVGGDADTWPTVTITGPVLNPYVEVDGWHCGIRGWIPAGQSVTIDAAPWSRTAVDGNGSSMGGRLDFQTYLDRMRLSPGAHAWVFGGSADTNVATATVKWRNAFNAL